MKAKRYIGILLIMAGFCMTVQAQQVAKKQQPGQQQLKNLQHNFYRRNLQVDSAKAIQVALVQDAYKASLKALVADTSLRMEARRIKIKTLIDAKNQQLQQLLTPAQQAKMIPTTERVKAKTAH